MNTGPKVLLVEDDPAIQIALRHGLGENIQLLEASTLDQATSLFFSHSDIVIVLMDACLSSTDDPDTCELVQVMRASGFERPIIAISSISGFRQQLLRAGCNEECTKSAIVERVHALTHTTGEISVSA